MTDIKQYEPLWGSWHVESLLGEGSYGKVYKLRREEFSKTYFSAVKLLSIPHNESEIRHYKSEGMSEATLRSHYHTLVSDLVREIEMMSEFKGNSNIVSLEDHKVITKADGIGHDVLIRMELLTSLSDYVMEKPLSHDEVIKLGIHICRVLELFDIKGIIHRDIKPGNIFISQFGDFKLGDFGVARQVERSSVGFTKKTGTETYMAPEVWSGYDYSSNVDMYSLGIVMYRFLNNNRTPFLPEHPQSIMPKDRDEAMNRRMQGETLPEIKGISAELDEILLTACNFDPNARFVSPTEMREALEALSGEKMQSPVAMPVKNIVNDADKRGDDRTEMIIGTSSSTSLEIFEDDKTELMFTSRHADSKVYEIEYDYEDGINDEDMEAIEGDAHETEVKFQSVRAAKPAKKNVKKIVLTCAALAAAAVFVVAFIWSGTGEQVEPPSTTVESPEPSPTPTPVFIEVDLSDSDIQTPTPEPVFVSASLVWIVEPNLPHDEIRLCDCGEFVNENWHIVCRHSGQILQNYKNGHGPWRNIYVFDRERNLFGHTYYGWGYWDGKGMHLLDQWMEWHPHFVNDFLVVESVDFSQRERWYDRPHHGGNPYNIWDYQWDLSQPEAFSGEYAVMYGGRFVTDFIFDGRGRHFGSAGVDMIAVRRAGYWGLVNRNGNETVPFVFEHIVPIDNHSAFAKFGGSYGILDIIASTQN